MLIGTHKARKREIWIELARSSSTVAPSDLPTGKTSVFFIFKKIDLVRHLMVTFTEWAKPVLLRKRKDFLLYLSTEIVCVFCLCLNSWIFLCLQFLQDLLASSAACCTEGAWGCQERRGHGDVKKSQVCLSGIWLCAFSVYPLCCSCVVVHDGRWCLLLPIRQCVWYDVLLFVIKFDSGRWKIRPEAWSYPGTRTRLLRLYSIASFLQRPAFPFFRRKHISESLKCLQTPKWLLFRKRDGKMFFVLIQARVGGRWTNFLHSHNLMSAGYQTKWNSNGSIDLFLKALYWKMLKTFGFKLDAATGLICDSLTIF